MRRRTNPPRRVLISLALAALSSGPMACGDDGGGGAPPAGHTLSLPAAVVTVQERLDLAAFDAEAAADPALQEVATGLTPTVAGVAEDSAGARVIWAEGALADGARATAVRHCADDACVYAVQSIDTTGARRWVDAQGAPVAPASVGRPVLLKDLEGFDLDGKTVVATAGLTLAERSVMLDKADLPAVDFATRSFIALNTFGDAFGTDMSVLTTIASETGGFHEVFELSHVREEAVFDALRARDAMDVVVWLGQTVRQAVQDGGRAYRSVGMTVNRGGFGDATIGRDALAEALLGNVAGRPGLLVLAASNSYGDGSTGQPDDGSLWATLDDAGVTLVGVEGHADVEDILLATATLLETWLPGEATLADALSAANAALGGAATLKTNARDLDVTWVPSYEAVWDEAPIAASRIQVTAPFTATPYCAPPGEQKQPGVSTFTTAWAEVTFDGAYFEGHRRLDSTDLTVDTTIRGLITGWEVGDAVLIEAFGDFDKNFRDFHGFAEGLIERIDVDDETGKVTVGFSGIAHTAQYTDGDGQECVLNNPRLATTTSGLGKLELTP